MNDFTTIAKGVLKGFGGCVGYRDRRCHEILVLGGALEAGIFAVTQGLAVLFFGLDANTEARRVDAANLAVALACHHWIGRSALGLSRFVRSGLTGAEQ